MRSIPRGWSRFRPGLRVWCASGMARSSVCRRISMTKRAEAAAPFRLVVERELRHPPERVWRALTDADELAQWFWRLAFKAEVGHRFRIEGAPQPGWRGFTDCEVLALEPPRRMVWSFHCTDGPPSIVAFDVAPLMGGGTRLRIIHHGRVPPATLGLLDEGWTLYADRLVGMLAAADAVAAEPCGGAALRPADCRERAMSAGHVEVVPPRGFEPRTS
ncbi:MAG: SRPBCC domain-containing protein [Hyphomonadaceae bacterium]|nr:SRPBCC domain-containing protein [Hyphomonadaceae bacterium]